MILFRNSNSFKLIKTTDSSFYKNLNLFSKNKQCSFFTIANNSKIFSRQMQFKMNSFRHNTTQFKSLYLFSSTQNNYRKQQQSKKSQHESSVFQLAQQLKNMILETVDIRNKRVNKRIQDQIQKMVEFQGKNNLSKIQKHQQRINLKTLQLRRIEQKFRENQEFIQNLQNQQNQRAMIMIRLQTLWNDKYDDLSIDDLITLIQQIQKVKQLKNNQFKILAMLFLAVEIVKKCIKSPRINKNIICSTKSLSQNFSYIKKSIQGQIEARKNLQKTQKILAQLLQSVQKNNNRICFMKTQSLIHYLISQIFRSFHEPDLYNDKSVCLTSDPPRVVFDQPFHQQYDRFIQMAVLILFDKRSKGQAKSDKLEGVKDIFKKIKIYQQNKLEQNYRSQNGCAISIKKIKKTVNKMDKRVNIINWIKNFALNVPRI